MSALNGRYIRLVFQLTTVEDGKEVVKCLFVSMASAKELKLPSKLLMNYDTGRGDLRLYNDIDILRDRNIGFSPGLENTTGSQIVKCLISQYILSAMKALLLKKNRGQEVLDLLEGKDSY